MEENGPAVQPLAEDDPLASFASEHDDADLLRSAPDAPSRLMLAPPTGRLYRAAARTAVAAAVVALAAAGAYLYPAKPVPLTERIAHTRPAPPEFPARVEAQTVIPPSTQPVSSAPEGNPEPPPARIDPVKSRADDVLAEPSLLSGDWMMNTRVESSRLERYEGLRLGYRVTLRQHGNRINGTGWKISEDEQAIGATARTPITFEGTLNDDRLELTFTEQGRRRVTVGKLVLARHSENAMQGRFSSTAAQSSGVVEIYR